MGVNRPHRTMLAALGLVASLSGTLARAQTLGQSDVCDPDRKELDRERLALAALTSAGVSPYPYRWVQSHSAAGSQSAAQQLLAIEGFCGIEPKAEAGIPRCAKDDAKKLGDAQNIVLDILGDTEHYIVPASVTGTALLFAAGSPAVLCRPAADGTLAKPAPTTIAVPFDQKKIPLRLRGSTDGLQFDRNRDGGFAGVDKASLSFKSDRAGGKDTFKSTLVVAFPVPVVQNVFEFVPYFGFQSDTAKKDGQAEEITEKAVRAGALFDFRTHGRSISHLFILRPEYAANRKERSEILTATFLYQPIRNGWLNDAINITTPDNESLFSIIPRADLRVVAGDFGKLGTRVPADSVDFIRAGGQLGVTLTSDVKWLPLELTVTETYLHPLKGDLDDLSYLKGVFSIYFDDKKYFGVDLGYARGRRDDLLKREQSWTFGFGAKF